METRASHIAVGAFVLVLVAGIAGFVVWIGKYRQPDVVYYDIKFSGNVTGLQVDNTVRYRGIPVGRVKAVRIDPANPNLVLVTIEVAKGTPIRVDSVASLELQGITGVTYIQISGGSPVSQMLPQTREKPYPLIAAQPSKLEELFEGAPALLTRLNELADRLNLLLSDENARAISGTLANLETLTGALAAQSGGLKELLENGAAAADQLRRTGAEFQILAQDLRSEVKDVGGSARTTIADLQGTARAFSTVADELAKLVAENRGPIRDFTAYGLYEATQLMSDFRQLVSSLSRVAAQIERDPARFLLGDRARGFQAQ
ncbi:MAG: MCE family protein [Rhodospirillaceae bacterium]|nr:MCE family protein [Rhodospirillaceae bacterium]